MLLSIRSSSGVYRPHDTSSSSVITIRAEARAVQVTFCAARESQHQLPGLADEIMPEAVVRLFVDEPEAHPFIDTARGAQHVIRPQRDLPVTGLSGEADAFFYQAAADAQPSCFRFDEEKSQLGGLLRLLDDEHGADDLAFSLGDPAPLHSRVVVLDELRHDLRHERLEPLIPAVLCGVENAVAVDDPAHVAGPGGPQQIRHLWLAPNAYEPLDRSHSPHQVFLLLCRHSAQHRTDAVARARVERGEDLPTLLREPQEPAPAVGLGGSPVD